MDPILAPLINAGGLGAALGMGFWLFRDLSKTLREELAAERKQCHEDHEKIMTEVMEGRRENRELAEAVRELARGGNLPLDRRRGQ